MNACVTHGLQRLCDCSACMANTKIQMHLWGYNNLIENQKGYKLPNKLIALMKEQGDIHPNVCVQ